MKSKPFKLLIVLAVAAFVGGNVAVQAQISGDISFNGTFGLNAGLPSATAIDSYSGLALGTTSQTGSFSSMNSGAYSGLGFNTFTFGGNGGTTLGGAAASSYLWTVTDQSGNVWELFSTTAITVDETSGLLYITGSGDIEEEVDGVGGFVNVTPGVWSLTSQSVVGDTATLTFSATSGTTAVPDGGTTVLLLGAALTGLAAIKRYLS